jgi:hypothetical protein
MNPVRTLAPIAVLVASCAAAQRGGEAPRERADRAVTDLPVASLRAAQTADAAAPIHSAGADAPHAAPVASVAQSPNGPDDADMRCMSADGICGPEHLRGMTEAEITARYGPPDERAAGRWTYWLPHQCSDWRNELTVHFSRGRVVKATGKRIFTGEECE